MQPNSFLSHLSIRGVEWLVGFILLTWGFVVLIEPDSFRMYPTFAVMARWAPQPVWGMAAFCIGVARITALFINGRWRKSPQVRLVTSFLSAFIWTQIFLAVISHDYNNPWHSIVVWFIIADVYAAFTAAMDAKLAKKK
jgi:hypothetical protein